uniref:Uncharacterized protein n=1 Tax=Panagrolaimus sp. ES5 TaxID=591445 RepID=A0AC34GAA7_9BILA
MSKYYPEIDAIYEGELVQIKPKKDVEFINIFDAINFAPKEEKQITSVVVVKHPTSVVTKEKPKSSGLWCGPGAKKQKRTTSITSEGSIKKGTLNALQNARNKAVERARTFSMSKEYPEIGVSNIYEGELTELTPVQQAHFTNLFDEINFEPDIEGKVNVKTTEVKNSVQSRYPIISEAYVGEVAELLRHPDVETINLFDCVEFASESDDEIPISQSSNARDFSKKGSPDKPKKKQLRLFGKTRRSTSEKELDLTSYPKSEAIYSGPLKDITKVEEINDENLRKIVTIYHSGYSQPLFRHRFARERHEGIEEIGEAPPDYEILHFTSEETIPLTRMPELETLPLRSYAKYPIISFTESPKDMKRKFSKSKIIPESSSESSIQSESEVDIVPSLKPSK